MNPHPYDRDPVYRRLITSRRWARLRRAVLSARPLCALCAEQGRVAAAVEVHHIEPVEHGLTAAEKERLMFSPQNLLPLCHACHVALHTAMGRSGRRQAEAAAGARLERFKARFIGGRGGGAPLAATPGGDFLKGRGEGANPAKTSLHARQNFSAVGAEGKEGTEGKMSHDFPKKRSNRTNQNNHP